MKEDNRLEFYETPSFMLDGLVESRVWDSFFHGGQWGKKNGEFFIQSTKILEPCAGDGAISNYLIKQGYLVTTNDVDWERKCDFHKDATTYEFYEKFSEDYRVLVTNPPFSKALQIIQPWVERLTTDRFSEGMVAVLVRLSFLEPTQDRSDFLTNNPPDHMIVLPRWSFDGVGTDSVTSCWLIWYRFNIDHMPVGTEFPGISFLPKSRCPVGAGRRRK